MVIDHFPFLVVAKRQSALLVFTSIKQKLIF
ncbi:MAG: hypothetical protein ACI8P3_000985, partial [Saprospiraceae bacterium]